MENFNRSFNMMQRPTFLQFPTSWYQQFWNTSQLRSPASVPLFHQSYQRQENGNTQNQANGRADSRYMQYLAWNPQYYYNPYTYPMYYQPNLLSASNQNKNSQVEEKFIELIESVIERRALKCCSNVKVHKPRKALINSPERKTTNKLPTRRTEVSSPIITKISSPLPPSRSRNFISEEFQTTSDTSVSLSFRVRSEDSWHPPESSITPQQFVKRTSLSAGERIMSIPQHKIQELTSNVVSMFAFHEGEELYPLEKWVSSDKHKDTGDTKSNIRFLMNLLSREKFGAFANKLTKRQKRDLAGMIDSQVGQFKLKGDEWVKVCEDIVAALSSKSIHMGSL